MTAPMSEIERCMLDLPMAQLVELCAASADMRDKCVRQGRHPMAALWAEMTNLACSVRDRVRAVDELAEDAVLGQYADRYAERDDGVH